MSLNFPSPDASPYFDPNSGLKYIYNPSVKAWEAAIQPPVIIGSSSPSVNISGFLYWNNQNRDLYINDNNKWVKAVPSSKTIISPSQPTSPDIQPGQLWWNSTNSRIYIYTENLQWVDTTPALEIADAKVTISASPPPNPFNGMLWWDSIGGNLYIYYIDPDAGSSWVSIVTGVSSGGGGGSGGIRLITGDGSVVVTGDSNNTIISVEAATQAISGVVRRASTTEAIAGVETTRYITPETLQAKITASLIRANTVQAGIIPIATQAEVNARNDNSKAVTPLSLGVALSSINVNSGVNTGMIMLWSFDPAVRPVPIGWVECRGQSTNTDPALSGLRDLGMATIPDLRGMFVRGWLNDRGGGVDENRAIGSFQEQDIQSHGHSATGGSHTHQVSETTGHAHDITVANHTHSFTIPSHTHNFTGQPHGHTYTAYDFETATSRDGTGGNISRVKSASGITLGTSSTTQGGSIDYQGGVNGNTGSTQPTAFSSWNNGFTVTSAAATPTISISITGGAQTRPRNVALMYIIKT